MNEKMVKFLDGQEKEIKEKQKELDNLKELVKLYPNLQYHCNRWKKMRFFSKDVNNVVNKFDICHSCGRCSDAPLQVWPYLETKYGNIYSDPICFIVGEKAYYFDRPCKNWDEEMKNNNISENIINSVNTYFKDCKEEYENNISDH